MADEVVRMPELKVAPPRASGFSSRQHSVQRKCAACAAGGAPCAECEEEKKVQRRCVDKSSDRAPANRAVPPEIQAGIESARGGGAPLPSAARSFVEARFGSDFSSVRVHTGLRAERLAGHLNARAFTVGNDLFFGKDEFSPGSPRGLNLLAHELTHTLQQKGSRPAPGMHHRQEGAPAGIPRHDGGPVREISRRRTVKPVVASPAARSIQRTPDADPDPTCPDDTLLPDSDLFQNDPVLNQIRLGIFQFRKFWKALRLGDSGPAVEMLQELLLAKICTGYDRAALEKELSDPAHPFGPATRAAVRAFQLSNKDVAGQPLEHDGRVGPLTLGALDLLLGLHPVPADQPVTGTGSCFGVAGKQGAGIVLGDPAAKNVWILANFDIGKSFIKRTHWDALNGPILAEMLPLLANGDVLVTLVGEASSTDTDAFNQPLSENRAKCVATALERINAGLKLSAGPPLHDIKVEVQVGFGRARAKMTVDAIKAAGGVPTQNDIENPLDRRVLIEFRSLKPKPEKCDRQQPAQTFDVSFGCRDREGASVVIGTTDTDVPIYRHFTWEKVLALPPSCEFFPQLNPSDEQSITFSQPVRLGWSDDANAGTDFDAETIQETRKSASSLLFSAKDEIAAASFEGLWDPARCAKKAARGDMLRTFGLLKPDGPVECGDMPSATQKKCLKKDEECPDVVKESSATKFKAELQPMTITNRIIDFFSDLVPFNLASGTRAWQLKIGTDKKAGTTKDPAAPPDKKDQEIWRPFVFVARQAFGPEGCEARDETGAARGTASPGSEKLSDFYTRPASLRRTANSNEIKLDIPFFGTFTLFGEDCVPGDFELILGQIVPTGGVRCGELKMDAPPTKQECKEGCPAARRTCPHEEFIFRIGRMDPRTIPAEIQRELPNIGCDIEAAQINIGHPGLKGIWRSFLWIQSTDKCRFEIEGGTVGATGTKLTAGVDIKFKFKWPPIGFKGQFEQGGLQLANSEPDSPDAPSDFSLSTTLTGGILRGESTSSSVRDLSVTHRELFTVGKVVDSHGQCAESDHGFLIPMPGSRVECATWPPAPPHTSAPPDTCPLDVFSQLTNQLFLFRNRTLLAVLGSHPGIITSHLERFLGHEGEEFTGVRFLGRIYNSTGKLVEVVVVLDFRVVRAWKSGGHVYVTIQLTSAPCAYLDGMQHIPLRLNAGSCLESILQGDITTIDSKFSPLEIQDPQKDPRTRDPGE